MITGSQIFAKASGDVIIHQKGKQVIHGRHADVIANLCRQLSEARTNEKMKVLEMQLASACMLECGYCFNETTGYYERGTL